MSEAQGQIDKLTAQGDGLNAEVLTASAAVEAALTDGDAGAAQRWQSKMNTVGQTLAHLPGMLALAEAHKAAAAAQLPAAEHELSVAENYVANAEAEISRIENLGPAAAWDQPAPPAPREIPSGLGFLGEMVLRQRNAETTESLTSLKTVIGNEPMVRSRGRANRKDKSWKIGKIGKKR